MSAKKTPSDVSRFLASYDAAAQRQRFASTLSKPAYGQAVRDASGKPIAGYENILWGGRTAINLAYNVQKAYNNVALAAAYANEYRPLPGMGVGKQLEEARKLGKVPEAMVEMTPAAWRSVMENLPLEGTEGGRGLSVGQLINLVEGLADAAMGRDTKAAANAMGNIAKFAAISPSFRQFLPAASALEADAAASRDEDQAALEAAMSAVGAAAAS